MSASHLDRRPLPLTFHALAALGVWMAWSPPAFAQPSLSGSKPTAVAQGATTEVTLTGANLSSPLKVWTSFPAIVESATSAKDGKSAVVRFQVAAETPVQIGGIVAGNAAGVSDALLMMVDDLPTVAEAAGNQSAAAAQAVPFPCAVDGVGNGAAFDYFRIEGKKGQRVSVEAVAHRLGSAFDPVLRLIDANGAELANADDCGGMGADCQLAVVLPADGTYLIEVQDNAYRGGARYRLRIGDFPIAASPLPLGVRRGATVAIKLNDTTQFVTASGAETLGNMPFSWRSREGGGSTCLNLAISDLPEAVETEPNETWKNAERVNSPCAVSGLLQNEKDQDQFRFVARKGRQVRFQARSASLGSPAFVMMRVVNSDGATLAESAVGDTPELSLAFNPPADGEYGLQVGDLLFRGGPEFGYRIEIRDGPDFALALKNEKGANVLFKAAGDSGVAGINVQCVRSGFDGPVELQLVDVPADWTVLGGSIAAKAAETRLFVVPSRPSAEPFHVLKIRGVATIEGRRVERLLTTRAVLRAKKPAEPFPIPWQDGLLSMAVTAEAPVFFGVQGPKDPVKVQVGAESATPLTLESKAKDFKGPMRVYLEDTPDGLTASVKVEKDKYTLLVSATAEAEGSHKITLHAVAEHKGLGQLHSLPVMVEVAKPAAAASTAPAESKPES